MRITFIASIVSLFITSVVHAESAAAVRMSDKRVVTVAVTNDGKVIICVVDEYGAPSCIRQ